MDSKKQKIVTDPLRSRIMRSVKGSNTLPERKIRMALHRAGFRYRLHVGDLPGKPDIVLPKHRTIIFVHGCFWHRHLRCSRTTTPKHNADFWQSKFTANLERDRRNVQALKRLGWRVYILWECITADEKKLAAFVRRLERTLKIR
jgi:DNA mismatch endonuclease (patch repair protein)